MNAITRRHEALWTDIERLHGYWIDPSAARPGPEASALCKRHWQERDRGSCRGCPVNTHTKGRGCEGTPWAAFSRAVYARRKAEPGTEELGDAVVRYRITQWARTLVELTKG